MANGAKTSKTRNIASMWNKARETTKDDRGFGDPVPLETGNYVMQLIDAEIGEYGNCRKLRTKWCVLDEGEDLHKVCTQFDSIDDEERLVWLQRLMVVVGIDLDETSIETESDVLEAFKERIEAGTVCRVKVTEKDDYKNTRIQRLMPDFDNDQLVQPAEALKNQSGNRRIGQSDTAADKPSSNQGRRSAAKEDREETEAEVDVEEGDRVSWESDDGETVEGDVVGITDDGDAKVRADGQKKTVIKPADALTKLETASEETEEEEEKEEVAEIKKGSKVVHNGKTGVVTSVPPTGSSVQVAYDKSKKTAMVDRDELELEAEETEAEPEPQEATVEVGSTVIATVKGKDVSAIVKWLSEDGTKAKVKVGNQLIPVKVEDLAVEVDA